LIPRASSDFHKFARDDMEGEARAVGRRRMENVGSTIGVAKD